MDWVKQLNEVTAEDLAAVEVRLTQLNEESLVLRQLKAVFRAKLGIKPAPAPARPRAKAPAPKQAGAKTQFRTMASALNDGKGSLALSQRTDAAKFLMQNGPTKPSVVCSECDIPYGSATYLFNHPWFTKTERGIELTQEGKKSATAAA